MEDFTPKPYQLEMFEYAKKQNSILYLPSGLGKTFIPILLLKEHADQIRGSLSSCKKRTVFVVPNKHLVYQQAEAIRRHTALSVGTYEAGMRVNKWTDDKWKKELDKHEVLVIVAQIFLDLILSARLPLSLVNLLIVDECHYATGKHPMRQIMMEYENLRKLHVHLCPRVLGLTSCIVQGRGRKNFMSGIKNLEKTMHCALLSPSNCNESSSSIIPEQNIIYYEATKPSRFKKTIDDKLKAIENILTHEIKTIKCYERKTEVFKSISGILSNINYAMNDFGELYVVHAIKQEIIDLKVKMEKYIDKETNMAFRCLCSKLNDMYVDLRAQKKKNRDDPVQYRNLSDKIFNLLQIIKSCDKSVQGIIFVQNRNVAKLLCKLLLKVSRKYRALAFVKPLYILDMKQQEEALKKFAISECNILISTSVLEEVIGIENCNVVIRYEKPHNYRSFIQSRDRASVKSSKYFIMVEKTQKEKTDNTLAMYKEIENSIKKLHKDRELPNDSDTSIHFTDNNYIPPYEPYGSDGPKVTMNSAIPLINKYCSKLPRDPFTVLTPEIVYETRVESARKRRRLSLDSVAMDIFKNENKVESMSNQISKSDDESMKNEMAGSESKKPVRRNSKVNTDDKVNSESKHLSENSPQYTTPEGKKANELELIRAGIRLPINACLKTTVYGEWMFSKDQAKKSAALAVCQSLHEMGELDYHLNISENTQQTILQEQQEEPLGQDQPKTKKRKQIYVKETCEAFTFKRGSKYELYSVNIMPAESESNEGGTPLKREDNLAANVPQETTIGLLCKTKLINCPFPLYSPMLGEVEVNVKFIKSIQCIDNIAKFQIEHFHKLVFENLLQLNPSLFNFMPKQTAAFVVPLTSTGDFDNEMLGNINRVSSFKPRVQRNDFEYSRSNYEDAIIYPIHASSEPLFYVTKILNNMNPKSKCPDSTKSYEKYEQYFRRVYNMQIKNKVQPLLQAKPIIKELDYLRKPHAIYLKKKANPSKFIPELCGIMPLKASFWWQLMCIPSILHRLNSLCLAQELSKTINPRYCPVTHGVTKIDWNMAVAKDPEITQDNLYGIWNKNHKRERDDGSSGEPCKKAGRFQKLDCNQKGDSNTEELDKENESQSPIINPVTLLQALTLNQAHDDFDLESLEILGHSFLKFITAEYLSLKFPMDQEGRLSFRQLKLLCNLKLKELANIRGITKKIQGTKFVPYENGLSPGFIMKPEVVRHLKKLQVPHVVWPKLPDFGAAPNLKKAVDKVLRIEKTSQNLSCFNPWNEQELTNKCVTDVVEALIGAYILSCGSQAAIDFLHNLGVTEYKGISVLKRDMKLQSALVSEEHDALNEVDKIYQRMCLDRLEETIHYTFKDKSFIVEAITHNSYCKNKVTDCYHRMEFLGNALLDYLITGMVYCRHTRYTSGQISDIRGHFLINKTLAHVCKSHSLQQYLLHMSPKLQPSIDRFITMHSNTMDDNEDVDVPKVLGDLVKSIISAVFLDSGRSLQEAWNVVEVLMGDRILNSLNEIVLDPIIRLADESNDKAKIPDSPPVIGINKTPSATKMVTPRWGLEAMHKAHEGQTNKHCIAAHT